MVELSDIVITAGLNSPEVREFVLGSNGIAEGGKPGLIVVDMSSIVPIASRKIAAELAATGICMLDAPVVAL